MADPFTATVSIAAVVGSASTALYVNRRQRALTKHLAEDSARRAGRDVVRIRIQDCASASQLVALRSLEIRRVLPVMGTANLAIVYLEERYDLLSDAADAVVQTWSALVGVAGSDCVSAIAAEAEQLIESIETARLAWLMSGPDRSVQTAEVLLRTLGELAMSGNGCTIAMQGLLAQP